MSNTKPFKPRREEGFGDRGPKDFRGHRGPNSDNDEDRHRFNKYSKNDNFRGHYHEESRSRGRFEDREDGDRRSDFRARNEHRGKDDFRGKGSRNDFRGKSGDRGKGDFRAKGNDRAARQEARRRFFGNDED